MQYLEPQLLHTLSWAFLHTICRHSNQTYRALQYVIAAFPRLFTALSYIWIQLYIHGNKFVVCISRAVHKVLAHFWQKFKIQPSLIDTYAGLILLLCMRFAIVSVNLLQYTFVVPVTSFATKSEVAFYYDANLGYLGDLMLHMVSWP